MTRGSTIRRPLVGLLFLWIAPAMAHDDPPRAPRPVDEAVAHRPTAIPDRIILTFVADPARSMAVTWRTDDSVDRALAQLALADPGPLFVAGAKSFPATSERLVTDLGPARFHSVVFSGLEPATQYAYRVGDGVNWGAWAHFRTAAAGAEPFSFLYFGDAQNDIKSLWSRVVRGAYSEAPRVRFIVHAGDLVNRANRDAEWGEWHEAAGWVNAMVPSLPTPGNHEYERPRAAAEKPKDANAAEAADRAVLSRHWRPGFALPTHGPKGLEETAYFIDYQGTRIISLNSNEKQAEQVPWLERILADNPNRWTILTFHHPIYSAAKDRDNKALRDLWQPVFDRYKVDLVLQGHDHTYARSGLRTSENVAAGATVRDEAAGTVYVVSVSGPKMYNLQKLDWMKRAAEDTQLYQVIRVDGGTLRFEARTATGDLYDAFDLVKRPGKPNELVDRAPKTPERRRPAATKVEEKAAAAGD